MDAEQAIEPSSGFASMVVRDGRKSLMDEHDDKCRQSSKTRRSVDAYPDFQSVIRTHRLLAGGCSVPSPLVGELCGNCFGLHRKTRNQTCGFITTSRGIDFFDKIILNTIFINNTKWLAFFRQ